METFNHTKIHDDLVACANPLLVCDERVDGDSLGSALALADALIAMGKQPMVYVSEPVPSTYKHLPHLDFCTNNAKVFDRDHDVWVVLDCSDERYINELLSRARTRPKVINIDHHKTNTRYGDINQVVESAPATAQIVFDFFEHNGLTLTREASDCLLMGICFDTGVFTNSATDNRSLETASALILNGARIREVIRALFKNRSISALRVWGLALERLQESSEYGGVITCLRQQDMEHAGIQDEEIDGLSNFLSLVTDTPTLIVLRETTDGCVKVSMRSCSEDVSAIARANGGGGHAKAAGYTIKNAGLICTEDGCWKVEKKVKK